MHLLAIYHKAGLFNHNLLLAKRSTNATPHKVSRNAVLSTFGKYLMIQTISASLLIADKHCYEPWMLWQMFKWLGQSSSIEIEDTIFDLSPMW